MPFNLDYPLCVIDQPIAAIAARVGTSLEHWSEPGLGQASGFIATGPNDLICRAEELHERPSDCPKGFTVYVEAASLSSIGPESLLLAVLATLGVERSAVTWLQAEQGRSTAAALHRHTLGKASGAA